MDYEVSAWIENVQYDKVVSETDLRRIFDSFVNNYNLNDIVEIKELPEKLIPNPRKSVGLQPNEIDKLIYQFVREWESLDDTIDGCNYDFTFGGNNLFVAIAIAKENY